MRIADFIDAITGSAQSQSESKTKFRKARISPTWDGSLRPPVIFDGESEASTRTFPYLASYTPVAGDVVLLVSVSHGWIILDRIVE